jgi:hypothetical protein
LTYFQSRFIDKQLKTLSESNSNKCKLKSTKSSEIVRLGAQDENDDAQKWTFIPPNTHNMIFPKRLFNNNVFWT